ncbi:non-ribosomal peptide synthetase [Streptomyces alboniger]|uniref:Non-ribosomal peptide synthetase n=2 Tax=Streptomyces alboniger TaxID=132473 RepID=A0A5J6HTT1_STRAD|nr:non-ribosomal peptide synthetase [Streptomyces alboniger]
MSDDMELQNASGPASAEQTRFFLLDQQGGRATLLHHIRVDGPVDPDRLTAAVRSVVAAQPALRTSLHPTADGLLRRLHTAAEVDIATERSSDETALRARIAETGAPFAHGQGPLCRIRVVVTGDGAHCLVGIHHAVFDEESAAVLLRLLADAYAGTPPRKADDRRPAPAADRVAALEAFWSRELDNCPAHTALPRIASAEPPGHATVSLPLPAELSAALHRRARATGATVFAQLLAAVGVVAGWYSGSDDVVLATVATTRTKADQDVIGCLQNTLPVRLRLAGADTSSVSDLAADALFDALDHAELPVEDILRVSRAERSPERKPLTGIICTQASAPAQVTATGLVWRLTPPSVTAGEYPLAVTLHRAPDGGAGLNVEYDRSHLPTSAAESFTEHLLRALGALTTEPAVPLTRLRLTGEGRPGAGTTACAEPHPQAPRAVPDHVAEHARRSPGATALVYGGAQVGYAELDHRVGKLAAALIEAGVRPGDRVAVRLARTPDLLVALLAVWRAGAAYVPLDPDYPVGRLRLMIEDAQPSAIIGTPVPGTGAAGTVVLAPDAAAPVPERWPRIRPEDPAYVIYTSGSTGRPKGVIVRHENLSALFTAFDRELSGPPAVTVAATSVSFDISALELFWPLTAGRAVLLTGHREVAGEDVPTGALYQCTPTVARILTDDPNGRRLLGRLGTLLVGGEQLPRDLADRLDSLVPGEVLNCYGPTETTVWSTVWRVRPHVPVHIGHPLGGEECLVVDPHDRPLPPGLPGRLLVLGAGVGSGYWRRPDLTADRFREYDGRPAYDTGDLAVLDPEHGLRFLGRADGQVKILGQRIELAEIESVLRAHPAVRDALVTVASDGATVTACLVPASGGPDPCVPVPAPPGQAEEIRRHAAASLVPAMVPAVWLLVGELPQLPNGKLDRATAGGWVARAMPSRPGPPDAEPAGRALDAVRLAWERVLGVPVADLDTTFFDLGGTSAGLLRVLVLLAERYPELTAAELFRRTTVRGLARWLDAPTGGADTPDTRPAQAPARGASRARALGQWRRRTERSQQRHP